jgi:hypothetical protein
MKCHELPGREMSRGQTIFPLAQELDAGQRDSSS